MTVMTLQMVSPDNDEICGDELDNDCNGAVDDGVPWYFDGDGDGFGDPANTVVTCEPTAEWVDNDLDCDDTDAEANPDGIEVVLDGIDQDCDGADRSVPI